MSMSVAPLGRRGWDRTSRSAGVPIYSRAFGDVGLRAALLMHFQVLVGAIAKQLRAARPEAGESGDVLLGHHCGCLATRKSLRRAMGGSGPRSPAMRRTEDLSEI